MQEPLAEEEIEEIIAELLEVESKVSVEFSFSFMCTINLFIDMV